MTLNTDFPDPNHCEICDRPVYKEDEGACDYCDSHPVDPQIYQPETSVCTGLVFGRWTD